MSGSVSSQHTQSARQVGRYLCFHHKDGLYKCSQCGYTAPFSQLFSHMETHPIPDPEMDAELELIVPSSVPEAQYKFLISHTTPINNDTPSSPLLCDEDNYSEG
jgi:hypothetical protein